MKCKILHSSKGRIRARLACGKMTFAQADLLEYYLRGLKGADSVKVYDRTGDVVICYSCDRREVVKALAEFSFKKAESTVKLPEHTGRAINREYEDKLVLSVLKRFFAMSFVPAPLRAVITVCRSLKYLSEAAGCLLSGRIEVPVLDGTAIAVSMLRGDYATASSIMFLLNVGDLLDDWTHKRSVDDLATVMSLGIDKVWKRSGDSEALVPADEIIEGDEIVVRAGSVVPFDSMVVSGEAMVNQASMTGEPLAVRKCEGGYVYAGTVVEEGELVISVDKLSGSGRYDRIVSMIEESESLRSRAENKAANIADKLVPYSLGASLLTYLLTRNVTKAVSILMVDFSCALKLAMPVAVLSAMRDCGKCGITVKGGRYLEAVANADSIVFDKTGTLTYSQPKVSDVIPFGGNDRAEMLRLAACLEEHFPHSIANAVVKEAERRGLIHEEKHSKVEYIVAHGISSSIDGKKVIIGSYHFVFEDEGCTFDESEKEKFDSLPADDSLLYLALDGRLAAVICISDPLREEVADTIAQLRKAGFSNIVMMTGDSEKTAARVAARVGVDEYYSEVLPEDKAEYIKRLKEQGRTVVMIGDGINDSPALSEADCGIAISSGAAIAKEIADITISAEKLSVLADLKKLSIALMNRIDFNYKTIIGFNSALMFGGAVGVLPPAVSAVLHNGSTLLIGARSMTPLPAVKKPPNSVV